MEKTVTAISFYFFNSKKPPQSLLSKIVFPASFLLHWRPIYTNGETEIYPCLNYC